MTILFSKIETHIGRQQARSKMGVKFVTADGHFNFPPEFCVGMYGLTYSFYHHPKGYISIEEPVFCTRQNLKRG